MPWSCYELLDPIAPDPFNEAEACRYIGLTQFVRSRFASHVRPGSFAWVDKRIKKGYMIYMRVVRVFADEQGEEAKQFEREMLMKARREGWPIENRYTGPVEPSERVKKERGAYRKLKDIDYFELRDQIVALYNKGLNRSQIANELHRGSTIYPFVRFICDQLDNRTNENEIPDVLGFGTTSSEPKDDDDDSDEPPLGAVRVED